MKPQSKDSYQPRLRADHSKRWMRMGDGSSGRKEGLMARRAARAAGVSFEVSREGMRSERTERVVRMVWSGSWGSHVSI